MSDQPKYDATLTDWSDIGRLLRLIAINAYVAYSNTIVGSPAPEVEAVGKRMTDLQPGDLVIERSTLWKWAKHADEAPCDQYPAIGVLLRIANDPVCTQAELDEMHTNGDYFVRIGETLDEIPRERVYYIKPLDGTVPEYRWTNADFIRISNGLEDAHPLRTAQWKQRDRANV
jgi:hypothetical protein